MLYKVLLSEHKMVESFIELCCVASISKIDVAVRFIFFMTI